MAPIDTSGLESAISAMATAIKEQMKFTEQQEMTRAEMEAYAEEHKRGKESQETYNKELDKAKDALKKFGNEITNMGSAGFKFASAIGTSATKGIEIELKNRLAVASSLLRFNADLAVTKEQIEGVQKSFASQFTGAAQGMQISSKGTEQFASNLKKAFGSEFEATPDAMRALTEMGLSTTKQMTAFRQSTGRAGLSANQLTTLYNKNRLSFLLYGNSFAKTAVQAEKLGINLAGLQNAQKGLVTNLDGTIDTVAQLNQLGAGIDFGNLVRIAETEGPQALMAFVRASVPEALLQSTSTRALFEQLGISSEEFLKAGGKQQSAASEFERQLTEASKETSNFAAGFTSVLTRIKQALTSTFLPLAASGITATISLFRLAAAANAAAVAQGGAASKLVAAILPLTAVLVGITGILYGRSLAKEGKTGTGMLVGAASGALAGAVLGGSAGFGFGALPGALIGAGIGLVGAGTVTPANDMYSAGYGSRVLVTPNGAFALNNADDIVAGTNLFPKGALQAGGNNSDLVRKVDNLISALSSAKTTINVGGMTQTVPRLQLVGVYSRNEVR